MSNSKTIAVDLSERLGRRVNELPWSRAARHSDRNPFVRLKTSFGDKRLSSFSTPEVKKAITCLQAPPLARPKDEEKAIHKPSSFERKRRTPRERPGKAVNKSFTGPGTSQIERREIKLQVEEHQRNLTPELETSFAIMLTLDVPKEADVARQRLALPQPKDPRVHKTLVLDIDDTLVHVLRTKRDREWAGRQPHLYRHFELVVNGVLYNMELLLRPHLEEFFETLIAHYEIIVCAHHSRRSSVRVMPIM